MAVAEPTGNTENVCVSGVAEVRAPVVGVPVAGQLQEPGGGGGGHVRVQGSEGRHRRLPAGLAWTSGTRRWRLNRTAENPEPC